MTYTYDTSGNPLSYYNGTEWTFTWQNGRELATATNGTNNISYTYDLNGVRTSKVVDGVVHNYIYASGKLLQETYGNNTLDFFYDSNGTPFALKYNGTLYYYITNLQGDVMNLVDANGTVVATYDYDPFGNVIGLEGTMATTNPLRYRGYFYDSELGLYYLQSRYYDPELGRFINADTVYDTDVGLQGYNLFAYCGNSPANRIDISGASSEDLDGDGRDEPFLDQGGVKGGTGYGGGGSTGFRKGLKELTGDSGVGCHAHHIFPQAFSKDFNAIGIDNQNPLYGSWWEAVAHLQNSHEYNLWWKEFFKIDGVTSNDAFALVEFLSELFGFGLNY